MNDLMRRTRPDVVQAWMYQSNLLAGVVGLAAGVPVVWGIHCADIHLLRPSTRFVARIGGFAARSLAKFVVNCSCRSAELHARLGYARAPAAVIPNGFDPEVFAPDEARRAAKRDELGIEPDTILIGSITRWNVFKDIPTFLQGLRLSSKQATPVRCFLVGRGLDRGNSELMEMIRAAGFEGNVQLLGERSDIADIARAMDLHVLASASEAFPNVIAETMLCGTPNVVTDVGDSAIIVGDTGWVVPPRDPHQLARAITAAYDEWEQHPTDWQQRRDTVRRRIADRFTMKKMADAYEAVWRKVAGMPG